MVYSKEGHTILRIYTNLAFPSVLLMPIGNEDKEQLRKLISHYIVSLEVAPRSFIDDWAEKLQKTFPLEKTRA